MFSPIDASISFPDLEEAIIQYWKKEKIFEKSISSRPANKKWTFLDGPPFITGLPHYGSLLSSIPKDVFPRYWTMKGYRVRRVWGWDCHGLPAENKVEEKLGLKRKRDIEEVVGVKKFIDECKAYVGQVSSEWEWYVDHVGRWVDFSHAYKTMDRPYMESVMWVFQQMYQKGYIYKGLRVSLYCPHCATPISNFEVAMDADNYKKVTEPSTTYKYEVEGKKSTYFLAWSTTPWNKIATPALAVNPDLTYVTVKQKNEIFILAKDRISVIDGDPYTILDEYKGSKLVGMSFIPHFDFTPREPNKKVFVVIPGSFVTADDGTGIVTIAAYGEDDLTAMKEHDIQVILHVDDEGMIKPNVPKWGGIYYLKANTLVDEDLKARGLVYKHHDHTHTIPTCWRCHTRLFYAPQDAWYVNVQDLKARLKQTNEAVDWIPPHFKYGRYLKSLESAPDWCISRSRYWGSPVPVWECECGERRVPGSIKELEEWSGKNIDDLHKPGIDTITMPCLSCNKDMHRVSEVLDSWIEAGSAPYAERHFPFENGLSLDDFFPPDFIVEYTGQIRAWFYVLHVIGTALFDSHAFNHVAVTGVILGTDGRKMSKNYGNYPDPKEMLKKYGGDALRLYLMGSPVMHGEDIVISEEEYRQQVRGYLLVLWNVYKFFVTYANQDRWSASLYKDSLKSNHILDIWILTRLHVLVKEVTTSLDSYDTVTACQAIRMYIDDLSTWYLRRSRDRVGVSATDKKDTHACYNTLYTVLLKLCQIMAPLAPFISEKMYTQLSGAESVHLTDWPESGSVDENLLSDMVLVRKMCEVGHSERKKLSVKVRQPLASVSFSGIPKNLQDNLIDLIKDELNVKMVHVEKGNGDISCIYDSTMTQALVDEGKAREIVRSVQMKRKELQLSIDQQIHLSIPDWPQSYTSYIKRETLASTISKGVTLNVSSV